MSVARLSKRIREVKEENNKVIVVDLEVIDEALKGLVLPFKIKPFNEVLKIKAETKLPDIDIKDSIKVISYRNLSESTKRIYKEIRPDLSYDSALITVIDDEKNKEKFKARKLENSILDSILHIDFDSVCEDEEGKEMSLWEDLGLERGDYVGALQIFCNVLNQEDLINCFSKLVESLKNRITNAEDLKQEMLSFKFFYALEKLPKEKQEEIMANIEKHREKVQADLKELSEKVKDNLEDKSTKDKKVKTNKPQNKKE